MPGFYFLLITLVILAGCSKKDRLGDFTEAHHAEKSLFLYPSTLRMLNLENNEDFNEMIKDLEKGRYFSYPFNEDTSKKIKELEKQLLSDGYEELLEIKNKDLSAHVYLLDQKTPLIFASVTNENMISLVEIEGMINPVKIPGLLENFNNEEFLNILNINQPTKNDPHFEHSENKQPE